MKAIVSLSGGMDSATVLHQARQKYLRNEVLAVSFCYGSKHNYWENKASDAVADYYQVGHHRIDISATMLHFKSDLLLYGGALPHGHYEEESMKQTVVPCRNLIFASILAGIAVSEEAEEIWLGVHAGDHAIYPDCRPRFVVDLQAVIRSASDKPLVVQTPFLHITKKHILNYGLSQDPPVPYHLTRTCYSEDEVACGKCGSCQERLASFAELNIEDPIQYQSREIMPKGA